MPSFPADLEAVSCFDGGDFNEEVELMRFAVISVVLMFGFGSSICWASRPPNIVHIIADDLGWNDVGFHGSDIRTPQIDAFATNSVILDRFYVTPICSPTRAGLLTGRYPFRFGIWNGVISPTKRHGLPPEEVTTGEILSGLGYQRRALLGKWHLGLASTMFHPLQHGFSEFYGHYNGALDYFSQLRFGERDWHRNYSSSTDTGYTTEMVASEAVRFIERSVPAQPFFLMVAFNAPHSPLQAKADDLEDYGFRVSEPLAPNTDRRLAQRENALDYGNRGRGNSIRQTFSAMVSSLDTAVGRILNALEGQGIADDTIVVFHSDNGGVPQHGGSNLPLRGNKFTSYEGGVRVVAAIRWPGVFPAGTVCREITAYIDLLPTFVDSAGGKIPMSVDGISLIPVLQGRQRTEERILLLGETAAVGHRWKLHNGEIFDLKSDPHEKQPANSVPDTVRAAFQEKLRTFGDLRGAAVESNQSRPAQWPPKNWELPVESPR
jgi:arylsulfatase B